jgi:HSP20 family protein
MAVKKGNENKISVRPSRGGREITTRNPTDLWSEMDNIFENFRLQFDNLFWPWRQGLEPVTTMTERRTPPMDVADLGDHYEMRLEMPGIPKDDIHIEVTPNTIEVSAEHEESKEDKDKNWLRRERSTMSYYRALELPDELKTDNVDAEFRDGVLTIKLPKANPKPEHKPKKVQVKG